jgi:protein-tyrosine-phosphatase
VRHLAGCKFIEAHEAVKGTRAERPVVDLIVTMTNHINELTQLQDRLDNVLDYYGLDEPTADQVYDAWERDSRPAPAL